MIPWHVYILTNATNTRLYTGISTDVGRRLKQHNGWEPGGAYSTRPGRPWELLYTEGPFPTRGDALRREAAIKKMSRETKLALVDTG